MPMLNPTAALLDNLLGLAPCFKYDQNGSVTCATLRISSLLFASDILQEKTTEQEQQHHYMVSGVPFS